MAQVTVQVRYDWKVGRQKNADPQVVGEELEKLGSKTLLTPAVVVSAAKKATSPLHPLFTWDDKLAAEKQRLLEARQMINSLALVIEEQPPEKYPQAFFSIQDEDSENQNDRYYVSVTEIYDPVVRTEILSQCKLDVARLVRKYNNVKEFDKLRAAMEDFLQS